MPHVTEADLMTVADRLRALVERSSVNVNGDELRVTISVGAYLCREGDTVEAATAKADRLMYESKENGRNRVTLG